MTPNPLIPPEYLPVLTLKELARRWGKGSLGYRTLHHALKKSPHLMPRYLTVGRNIYFPLAWVEEFERETVVIHDVARKPPR